MCRRTLRISTCTTGGSAGRARATRGPVTEPRATGAKAGDRQQHHARRGSHARRLCTMRATARRLARYSLRGNGGRPSLAASLSTVCTKSLMRGSFLPLMKSVGVPRTPVLPGFLDVRGQPLLRRRRREAGLQRRRVQPRLRRQLRDLRRRSLPSSPSRRRDRGTARTSPVLPRRCRRARAGRRRGGSCARRAGCTRCRAGSVCKKGRRAPPRRAGTARRRPRCPGRTGRGSRSIRRP